MNERQEVSHTCNGVVANLLAGNVIRAVHAEQSVAEAQQADYGRRIESPGVKAQPGEVERHFFAKVTSYQPQRLLLIPKSKNR